MLRALPLLLMAGLLAGCAGTPEAVEQADEAADTNLAHVGCYQSGWQAETVPVIYKRGGQEVWDRYEFMPKVGNVGCH